jgi:alkanesulfonate monooxygenase SsuD/methylene tetrahydromethanopterin reductase-like flavin-dependent oxidoreductase (luciferase family)
VTDGFAAPRLGVTLPTFAPDAGPALRAAAVAEAGGLDGVFAFDHLWPIGRPGRPALWSFGVLAAVAASTSRVAVGPLVARVQLLNDDDLLAALRALGAIAGRGRVIAGIGAGDKASAEENGAYGVAYPPARERLDAVAAVATRAAAEGLEVWVGGNSPGAAAVARDTGASRNLWGVTVEEMKEAASGGAHVTWGGQALVGRDEADLAALRAHYGDRPGLIAGTVTEVASRLSALAAAGARWCVLAPLDYHAQPEYAVETVCLVAEAVR